MRQSLAQRGFSIIDVVIVLGISSFLILSSISALQYLSRSTRMNDAVSSRMALAQAIYTQLSRKETCAPSFTERPSAWAGAPAIVLNIGDITIRGGEDVLPYGLHVNALNLANFQNAGTNPTRLYMQADVRLTASSLKLSGQVSPEGEADRYALQERIVARIVLELERSSNALISCYAIDREAELSKIAETTCAMFGGQFDPQTQRCELQKVGGRDCAGPVKQFDVGPLMPNGSLIPKDLRPETGKTYCLQSLPTLLTSADIRADDSPDNYIWDCRGTPASQSCFTRYKKIPPLNGNQLIPSGTRCSTIIEYPTAYGKNLELDAYTGLALNPITLLPGQRATTPYEHAQDKGFSCADGITTFPEIKPVAFPTPEPGGA